MESGIGLERYTSDPRIQLLQPSRGSDKGSAGPQPRHKVRDAACRLLENLRCGSLVVRLPVGGIVVLVRVVIEVRIFLGKRAHAPDGAVRSLPGVRVDNFGALGFENSLSPHAE